MPRKPTMGPARVARDANERLKALGWTRTEYVKLSISIVKGNWNNQRK